jgi:hypothetical protein
VVGLAEIAVTKRNTGPKLSRRYAFVKRRLLRLPQQPHSIEVDFCPLPDIVPDESGFWLGLVVDHEAGTILRTSVLEAPPSAEDAADIVAGALECSHFRAASRPSRLLLRDNPSWEALFPWLEQVGIETVVTEDLWHWDAKADESIEWMKKEWRPVPDFMRSEIHEELGIFGTLSELRILTYRFLYFEQT